MGRSQCSDSANQDCKEIYLASIKHRKISVTRPQFRGSRFLVTTLYSIWMYWISKTDSIKFCFKCFFFLSQVLKLMELKKELWKVSSWTQPWTLQQDLLGWTQGSSMGTMGAAHVLSLGNNWTLDQERKMLDDNATLTPLIKNLQKPRACWT